MGGASRKRGITKGEGKPLTKNTLRNISQKINKTDEPKETSEEEEEEEEEKSCHKQSKGKLA
eukprot:14718750-Ditylum_brightwellii.AAC.1